MQEMVREFLEDYGLRCSVETRYIDWASESGELGKEILKSSGYGARPFALTDAAAEEWGDCLFSLLALAVEMGVDAQDALDKALAKYRERLIRKGTASSDAEK